MANKKRVKGKDTRVEDLARLHRDIEHQVFMSDEDDLQLLSILYLTTAVNIMITLRGAKKAKIYLQDFINKIQVLEPEKND